MQSILSRIWTRVAVSISYDDNHYTTGTSSVLGFLQSSEQGYVKYQQFPMQKIFSLQDTNIVQGKVMLL